MTQGQASTDSGVGAITVEAQALAPGQQSAKDTLRRYWTSIGRPTSLGLRVPLLYAPIGAIGPVLLDQPANDEPLIAWIGVALAGEIVLIASFWVAGRIVHVWSPTDRPRPLATLLALLSAAVARGIAIAILAAWLVNGPLEDELSYRLTAAVLLQAGFLVMIALNVHAHDDHRILVSMLEDRRRQLAQLDASAQERLEDLRLALVGEIRTTIEPEVERLLSTVAAVPGANGPAASAQAIAEFVDHQVRPLGHRLASSARVDMRVDLPATGVSGVRAPLPRRIALGDCILITPSIWLMLVAGVVGAIRNAVPGGQFAFVAAMVLPLSLTLLLARRLAAKVNLPTPMAIGIVIALSSLAPMMSGYVLWLLGIAPIQVMAAGSAVGAVIGAGSAVYGSVNRARRDAEMQLWSAVASLEASVNVLQQKAWILRRQLGYVTHGAIQGALYAAAMRLSAMTQFDKGTIEAISQDVVRALSKLDSVAFENVLLEGILEDIATLWNGQCTVRWSLDEGAARQLRDRPETSACIGEIAREAVANAIHHGGARQVTIRISAERMLIRIEVGDDGVEGDGTHGAGTHGAGTHGAGLGTQMLDDMCMEWSRERSGASTVLRATLGLGTETQAKDELRGDAQVIEAS